MIIASQVKPYLSDGHNQQVCQMLIKWMAAIKHRTMNGNYYLLYFSLNLSIPQTNTKNDKSPSVSLSRSVEEYSKLSQTHKNNWYVEWTHLVVIAILVLP